MKFKKRWVTNDIEILNPSRNNDPIKIKVFDEKYVINGPETICWLDIDIMMGDLNLGSFLTKGKSKCLDTDTYDETIGKKIAQTKATQEAYDKAWARLLDIRSEYNHRIANIENFRNKYADVTIKNTKYSNHFNKK